jgi:hypothetical protein
VETIKCALEVNTLFQLIRLGFTPPDAGQMMSPMKKIPVLLLFAALLTLPTAAFAANSGAKASDPNPQAKKLAETISMITGVAISPLLGVSAIGAYDYFKATTPEQKAKLSWFANPLFWIPALLLVGACFLKDSAGIAVPVVLKKPFDVAETIEHKISGLVATAAFVPIAASIFQAPDQTGASLAALGFATIDLHWLYNALLVPVAMAAFVIVFLASNAINILILLSPFTAVDAALKTFRTTVLASVAGTAAIGSWSDHPWLGAAWALVVILFSWLIAGWSLRLSHFGIVFIWDFVTGRKSRFRPDPKENKLFLGAKTQKVPTRTYGKLLCNEQGELMFVYHPWLVLPPKTIVLPPVKYVAGRGLFYSEIMRIEGDSVKTTFLLPPRYLGHEEEVAKIYNFSGTRDVGIRAAWAWLKSMFGGRRATT